MRKPTTGRYDTREELERMVRQWNTYPGYSVATIAAICRVSEATVRKILSQ